MKDIVINKTAISIALAVGLSCGMMLSANAATTGPVNSAGVLSVSEPTVKTPAGEAFSETIVDTAENSHTDTVPETRVPVEPVENENSDVVQRNTTPEEQTPVAPQNTGDDKEPGTTSEPVVTEPEVEPVVEEVVEDATSEPEVTEPETVGEESIKEIIVDTTDEDVSIGDPSSFSFVSGSPEVINAYHSGDYSGIERNTTPTELSSISYTPLAYGQIEIKWSSGAYHATVIVSSYEDVTNFVQFVTTVLRAMSNQN